MKNLKSFQGITPFLMAILISTSCNSPAAKVEKAEDNVMEANQQLDEANKEYMAEVENYRKETSEKISSNDQRILELKANIANQKKEVRADYQKKIAALEQKNQELRKKMDDYKADSKDNWEAFKKEFNHDMEELGNAFKDLTVKNVK